MGKCILVTCTCEIDSLCHTIQKLINDINEEHQELSTTFFMKNNSNSFNLRRKQVNHITEVTQKEKNFSIDSDFLKLLSTYREELNFFAALTDLGEHYNQVELRTRTKESASIVNKLKFYRLGKIEAGKMPINKCLNDLFGFRIYLDSFDHTKECFQEACKELKNRYKNRIDFRDASKGNYKAFHFYLYGESWNYFPWELQIWKNVDRETNDSSHKEHKQQYTKWAEIHKYSNENELKRW